MIEAVAIEVTASPRPEGPQQAEAPHAPSGRGAGRAWQRLAGSAARLDRHAFSLASLTLALGIGWLIGANSFGDQAAMRAVAEGLHQVDAKVAAIVRQVDGDAQGRELASLKRTVDGLKASAEAERQQYRLELAWLSEKLDAAGREPAARLQSVMQRLDAVEARTPQQAATTSGPESDRTVTIVQRSDPPMGPRHRPGIELPPLLSASARAALPLHGYVLRRVAGGMAYVEGRDGLRTVEPGHVLPGAGRVTKIEKRAQGWVVVTSRGVIDSDLY